MGDWAGQTAALLTLVEWGLGSTLHAFSVPFAGQALSLNQGFMLCRATLSTRHLPLSENRYLSATISNVAAVLKSLSPAGKKLTPMLAICMQGLLFNLGTLLVGQNFLGFTVAFFFLSAWAFVQPVLIYWLLFGRSFFVALLAMADKARDWLSIPPQYWLGFVLILFLIKFLFSLVLIVLAYRLPEARVRRFFNSLPRPTRRKFADAERRPSRLALQDLLNPLFLLSYGMTGAFFYFAEAGVTSRFIWILIRPLAVGYLVFYAVRATEWGRFFKWMDRSRLKNFSKTLRRAVEVIQKS